MKLLKMTAAQSLGGHSIILADLSNWGQQRGIVPAVTEAERDAAQARINHYCHNLQPCDRTESRDAARDRRDNADACVADRKIVQQYYYEREPRVRSFLAHEDAIAVTRGVADSCHDSFWN